VEVGLDSSLLSKNYQQKTPQPLSWPISALAAIYDFQPHLLIIAYQAFSHLPSVLVAHMQTELEVVCFARSQTV